MPKQAIVYPRLEAVEIVETPIPTPGPKEVVIKVSVAGTNPKDWKFYMWDEWIATGKIPAEVAAQVPHNSSAHNSGDDVAGIVHSVGENVHEFKPGDRVAAMHEPGNENGGFAEYTVAADYLTFHVPHHVSFEEAATIPTAGLTTALALFSDLQFPPPWASQSTRDEWRRVPFLIYGVTTSVGAFAAKLARLSGFQLIIGVAGRAADFANTLVDYVIDYRNGEDAIVEAVEGILKKEGLGRKIPYIFDAVSEEGSLEAGLRLIDPNGSISTMLPPQMFAKDPENFKYPPGVTSINTAAPQVLSTHKDFAYLWLRYFGKVLENERFKGHPHQVVPGGLGGVLTGLRNLRDGKASGFKYIFRIEETDFSKGNVTYKS
ncbi:putative alcohol dehydrogenase [Astrocystis sublimbata]|nr:putative alcohol dehydrogenase [Astrocystis sublimbata]